MNQCQTVTDTKTNLTWKRCSEGQTWTGTTCNGVAKAMTWNQAMVKRNDWRVPTIEELQTLVYCSNGMITVNAGCIGKYQTSTIASIFINTPTNFYWSESRYIGGLNNSWSVYFGSGQSVGFYQGSFGVVRLVHDKNSKTLEQQTEANIQPTISNQTGTLVSSLMSPTVTKPLETVHLGSSLQVASAQYKVFNETPFHFEILSNWRQVTGAELDRYRKQLQSQNLAKGKAIGFGVNDFKINYFTMFQLDEKIIVSAILMNIPKSLSKSYLSVLHTGTASEINTRFAKVYSHKITKVNGMRAMVSDVETYSGDRMITYNFHSKKQTKVAAIALMVAAGNYTVYKQEIDRFVKTISIKW